MKKIIFLSAMALFGLSNCQDDEIVQPVDPVQSGDEIQFGMTLTDTSTETKTIYGDPTIGDNGYPTSYPVYWEQNDEIMIFCAQADGDVKRVNYSITPNTANPAQAERVDKMSDEGLRWGSENVHRFYGIYPASAVEDIEESDQSGEIKFSIPTNQLVAKWKIERNDQGGITYNGIANTEYAYMYAYTEVHKDRLSNNELVDLRFKPLTTVLEVTINGPIEVPNTENSVTVSNLNIEAIDENRAPILTGDFICHMRPTDNGTEIGDISVSDAGSSEESRGYISIPLYIRQGTAETSGDVGNVSEYEEKAIALGPNDKIRVRGFFLRGDNNNEGGNIPVETLQLRVATIGGEANVKKLETGAILNHKVNIVNLPAVKKEGTNYWISSLDPNIYISELSMPGSKFSYLTSENHPNTTVYQGVDIDTQFQDGVRAFIVQTNATVRYTADYNRGGFLRDPYYDNIRVTSEGEDLLLAGFSNNRGLTLENTLESISAALDRPINELGNNCQEYAVVLLTYDGVVASFDKPEDDGGGVEAPGLKLQNGEDQNIWMRVLAKKLESLKNSDRYKIYTDPITANTRIEDVKNHIIIKVNYNGTNQESEVDANADLPALFSMWDGTYNTKDLYWGTPNPTSTRTPLKWMYQEATHVGYNTEITYEAKTNYIAQIFNRSVEIYQNNEGHDTWFMNDLGGTYYNGYYTDDGASRLAKDLNEFAINTLQNRAANASLGLVFMNYADVQPTSGQLYRSDELIQTVIDNNFKFNLRKAGN